MGILKSLLCGVTILFTLTLTACNNSGSNNNNTNSQTQQTISIQIPDRFPYNQEETINVSLTSSASGGLGFSNLTLHTAPNSSVNLLTISNDSTCLSIQPNSTATSCTFIVTNNNSSTGESTLGSSYFYVTGQADGATIVSNRLTPGYQPPTGTYWPITINNQTGANQYLFVFGQDLHTSGDPHVVVVFDNANYGTAHTYSASTNYGSDNDSIILPPGNTTIHIPYNVSGGRAYLSNQKMIGLNLTSNGGIVTPSFMPTSNLNYDTIFDDFEFTYAQDPVVTTTYSAVLNQTQVDALGVPICITGTSSYVPIQQSGFCNISRTSLLSSVTTAFDAITDGTLKNQWNSTVLKDGSNNILRIMNPGSADAIAGTTPITSFADYLANYATDLFNSGDYSADDSLKVSLDGTSIISGKIVAGTPPTYTFTCTGPACSGQSGTMPLTTANLLTGAAPGGANTATILAYEMISSAFMAGQLPATQSPPSGVITQTYLRNLSPNTFYESNTVSTAPQYQYSVFSNALKGVQLQGTYTFPYNDVLGVSSTMTQSLTGPTQQPDPVTVTVRY